MAEAVLRVRLSTRGSPGGYRVASRATSSLHLGKGADPRALAALGQRAEAIAGHRVRQIEDDDFSTYPLIVAMDRGILRTLQGWAPADFGGTLRLLPARQGAREIEDPYSGGAEAFARALRDIEAGIDLLLQELG